MRSGVAAVVLCAAVVLPVQGQQPSRPGTDAGQTNPSPGARPSPVPTGLLFVDRATYESVPLASTPLMGELPPSADLSSRFPAPGNQEDQGSCVGWAVAYALKSYQEADERQWPLDDLAHVFSPAYIYNQIKRTSDCRGGTYYLDALNLVRREGVATWTAFPYDPADCSAKPSAAVKTAAREFKIAEWRRVNVQDDTEVRSNVAAGFPVLAGIEVDRAFFNLKGEAIYSQYSGLSEGGHAIVVVGYDDSREALKIINSWGSEWGTDGFGWISYDAFGRIAREGYVAQDIIVRPAPPVQPQPQPRRPAPAPPVPVTPTAALGIPEIVHNVPVAAPTGMNAPGMLIKLPGTVSGGRGKALQIVARFSFPNGTMLVANPVETVYRDATNFVAVGTAPIPITTDSTNLGVYTFAIPYYALNFVPTNGQANYSLLAKVSVYIDNFIIGEQVAPFGLRW